MIEAVSKKQRGMAVQILSKSGVDQSVSRGNERNTQRLITYIRVDCTFKGRKIRVLKLTSRVLKLTSIYVPTQRTGLIPPFI